MPVPLSPPLEGVFSMLRECTPRPKRMFTEEEVIQVMNMTSIYRLCESMVPEWEQGRNLKLLNRCTQRCQEMQTAACCRAWPALQNRFRTMHVFLLHLSKEEDEVETSIVKVSPLRSKDSPATPKIVSFAPTPLKNSPFTPLPLPNNDIALEWRRPEPIMTSIPADVTGSSATSATSEEGGAVMRPIRLLPSINSIQMHSRMPVRSSAALEVSRRVTEYQQNRTPEWMQRDYESIHRDLPDPEIESTLSCMIEAAYQTLEEKSIDAVLNSIDILDEYLKENRIKLIGTTANREVIRGDMILERLRKHVAYLSLDPATEGEQVNHIN